MPIRVEFNTDAVQKRLMTYSRRLANTPMDLIGQMLSDAVDNVIDTEGQASASGEWWVPLSPNTLRRHPRRRGGALLQATGQLANIQTDADEGARTVIVRSPAPYAGWHVVGTRKMPRRDFLDVDLADVLGEIGVKLTEHVASG